MCERDVYAKTADGHDVSKAEKKARKTMQKLGLEQLDDVQRVTFRKGKQAMFVINSPDVFHSPGSDSYVIFVVHINVSLQPYMTNALLPSFPFYQHDTH